MFSKHGKRRLFVETLESRRLLAADPGVLPVDSHAFATTYGEQAGEWWNWAFAEPAETNPLLDDTGENCHVNQSGKVWYLAGTFGDGPVERSCTIPTGKAIFVPVLNTVFFATEPDETEQEMRDGANQAMNDPQSLSATIDGKEIDPENYRAESPDGGFTLTLPEGSILPQLFGLDPGDYAPAVADGYWLMLAPLSRGTHELNFSAVGADGFEIDISYELEIVGGNGKSVLARPISNERVYDVDDVDAEPVANSLSQELTKSRKLHRADSAGSNGKVDPSSNASDNAEKEKDSADAGPATDVALLALLSVGL